MLLQLFFPKISLCLTCVEQNDHQPISIATALVFKLILYNISNHCWSAGIYQDCRYPPLLMTNSTRPLLCNACMYSCALCKHYPAQYFTKSICFTDWFPSPVAKFCKSLRDQAQRYTAWCSEIGSLTSLDAWKSGAFSDVREPISLHHRLHFLEAFYYVAPVSVHSLQIVIPDDILYATLMHSDPHAGKLFLQSNLHRSSSLSLGWLFLLHFNTQVKTLIQCDWNNFSAVFFSFKLVKKRVISFFRSLQLFAGEPYHGNVPSNVRHHATNFGWTVSSLFFLLFHSFLLRIAMNITALL